jgi:hypothetical protein
MGLKSKLSSRLMAELVAIFIASTSRRDGDYGDMERKPPEPRNRADKDPSQDYKKKNKKQKEHTPRATPTSSANTAAASEADTEERG